MFICVWVLVSVFVAIFLGFHWSPFHKVCQDLAIHLGFFWYPSPKPPNHPNSCDMGVLRDLDIYNQFSIKDRHDSMPNLPRACFAPAGGAAVGERASKVCGEQWCLPQCDLASVHVPDPKSLLRFYGLPLCGSKLIPMSDATSSQAASKSWFEQQ